MLGNFARFQAVVLDDQELQQRLRTIDDWERFTAEMLDAARECGIELTSAEIDRERSQALLGWLTRWA